MAIHKSKPSDMSPTLERLNLERWKKCSLTTESAKRLMNESRKLTQESLDLIEKLRKKRKTT